MKARAAMIVLGTALAIGMATPSFAQGSNERDLNGGGHPGQGQTGAQPPGKSDTDMKGTTGQGVRGAQPNAAAPIPRSGVSPGERGADPKNCGESGSADCK
jgi:hypothetical protein